MNNFQKNYWSMYLDFIRDFEALSFQGYSLPYLCHLPSYILPNTSLLQNLKRAEYSKNIKNEITSQKQFQQVFNHFIQNHTKKTVKKAQGKVVIHMDKLLRFPTSVIMGHFDHKRTILLTNGKLSGNKAIPNANSVRVNKKARAVPLTNTINVKQVKVKNNHPTNYKVKQKMVTLSLESYEKNIEANISLVQKEAIKLLNKYKDHHLYGHNTFRKWLLNNLKVVMIQIDATRRFLKHIAVSCVIVSTTHSYINRILAIVAASKGIPTICMQHGIIASELGYLPKIAAIDAVYGQYEKDWFINNGAPKGSVEVIGHPRFDQISQQSNVPQRLFQSKLGLDPKKKTVMFAVRGQEDVDQWRKLIQFLSQKLDINIVIKNYPSRSPHQLTKEFPNVYSTMHYPLYDIFANVDAVIAYPSTVGLEALISKKPVFILDKDANGNTNYYQGLDDLIHKNPKILAHQVYRYFSSPVDKKRIDATHQTFLDNAYATEKRSIDRLLKLIQRLTR
ncbi:hypothetical protein F9U64_11065 [Gracilibacillus oryzae]|uniref:Uncharacterized protein n=1 Tax=Gracilibacillus oryzae TaxID=1672701 RepID=A0A7C8GT15_9BACI|nr:hypothetical protein [Gracilibacillus oryzae]KAB8135800.1 hypothetical protein F9U64_11065 [Gracilibacillus oryzae]